MSNRFQIQCATIKRALALIARFPAGTRWTLCVSDDDTGGEGTLSSLNVTLRPRRDDGTASPLAEFVMAVGGEFGRRTGFNDYYSRRGLLEVIVEET